MASSLQTTQIEGIPSLTGLNIGAAAKEIARAANPGLDELAAGFKQYLNQRVASDELTPGTAENYDRQTRHFFGFAAAQAGEEDPRVFLQRLAPELTRDYLQTLAPRHKTVVRSILIGDFFRWAADPAVSRLNVDLTALRSLIPVPYEKFTLSLFEEYLSCKFPLARDAGAEKTKPCNALRSSQRLVLRKYLGFIAESKHRNALAQYRHDARDLAGAEEAGADRLKERKAAGPPYRTVIEHMHGDADSAAAFAKALLAEAHAKGLSSRAEIVATLKHPLSVLRCYFEFHFNKGQAAVRPEDIKLPEGLPPAPKIVRAGKPHKVKTAAPAPNCPAPEPVPPTARRKILPPHLRAGILTHTALSMKTGSSRPAPPMNST